MTVFTAILNVKPDLSCYVVALFKIVTGLSLPIQCDALRGIEVQM